MFVGFSITWTVKPIQIIIVFILRSTRATLLCHYYNLKDICVRVRLQKSGGNVTEVLSIEIEKVGQTK